MLFRLFLLFTFVPIMELALLLRIGGLIGTLPTVALVLATGAAGAWMARHEGMRSWRAVQTELAAGRLPGAELLHSLLILVAGVVLVTPGVLTDLAGLLLLVRPVRSSVIRGLRRRFEAGLLAGTAGAVRGPWGFSGEPPHDATERRSDGSERFRDGTEDGERDEGRRPPRIIEM